MGVWSVGFGIRGVGYGIWNCFMRRHDGSVWEILCCFVESESQAEEGLWRNNFRQAIVLTLAKLNVLQEKSPLNTRRTHLCDVRDIMWLHMTKVPVTHYTHIPKKYPLNNSQEVDNNKFFVREHLSFIWLFIYYNFSSPNNDSGQFLNLMITGNYSKFLSLSRVWINEGVILDAWFGFWVVVLFCRRFLLLMMLICLYNGSW